MSYWLSLLYLSTFGTVIAFACYFVLLKNIGPEKASYVIVLFPLVAVVLSTYSKASYGKRTPCMASPVYCLAMPLCSRQYTK